MSNEDQVAARRRIAEATNADLRLAGLAPSDYAKALQESWVLGELNSEEAVRLILARYQEQLEAEE